MGNLERAKNITTMEKLVQGTVQNASGTAIDFTGIPSWAKKITVMFNGVSTNGTSTIAIRLGTSSGLVVAGYNGAYGYIGASSTVINTASSFGIYNDTATDLLNGSFQLSLLDSVTNRWVCGGIMSWSTRPWTLPTSGTVALPATLDRIRLTTVNGTDAFDAGQINIMYEG